MIMKGEKKLLLKKFSTRTEYKKAMSMNLYTPRQIFCALNKNNKFLYFAV